jgi:hypothetical protein
VPHRWDPIAPPVTELVVPARVDPTGENGPTRGQAAGPGFRSTSPGRVVPASVTDDLVEQRILEAYAGAGPTAVVTGWAALRLLGAGHFDGLERDGRTRRPVPIAVDGGRVRTAPGRLVVRHTVPPDEVVIVHGIRCAKAERALFDEMRLQQHDPREMAVAAGNAFRGQLTSLKRMRLYVATRRWYRDKRIVAGGLALAAEGCRSPQEDRFRLVWELDAMWGPPLLNREVFDDGGVLVGIPDLLDPRRGVAGEYLGADHRDPEQHQNDVGRSAGFRRVGLEPVEVVGRDMRHRPIIVTRMAEAEARAKLMPQTWVLGPPASPTLDEILDARDAAAE